MRNFFEQRAFGGPYAVGDNPIGSPDCEDAWQYGCGRTLAETAAEFLLVPQNGSPISAASSRRVNHDGLPVWSTKLNCR